MSNCHQCQNCTHFKLEYSAYGICKLIEGLIGERCHKFSWCKDFQSKQEQVEITERMVSMYTITTEEFEIAREILKGLHLDVTDEDVQRHLDSEIITVNVGRDGEDHVWYQDDADCICIRVSDRHELSEDEINEQFL